MMARAAQIRLMMAEAEIIKAKFGNIPLFMIGDMNCEENTVPIQQLIQSDYKQCYKVAVDYGDNNNGHHICSPGEGYSLESKRKGPDRETGAIDHCLILDLENRAEVRVFDCIMHEYIAKLTDHYPLLLDVNL
jgi:endonuclease/exonuclease/phosphatase family metal-dependent hydrolase